MTIYNNHGKVLWNKVYEPVTGGKGIEQVVFLNGYTFFRDRASEKPFKKDLDKI
jgi:hypothetical protein